MSRKRTSQYERAAAAAPSSIGNLPALEKERAIDVCWRVLEDSARAAADEFIAAGTAANTVRSYRSALTYWEAWLRNRMTLELGDGPVPQAAVVVFITDHLARPTGTGKWVHELPSELDDALVATGIKAKLGALAFSTVRHRLAVLAKWHQLKGWPNPCDEAPVRALMREAHKAQTRNGVTQRKKTAVLKEPLQAMLETCSDGIRGVRDQALLLLAWSGGGRRRSEVVGLNVEDLRKLNDDTWMYALGTTKTDTGGVRREKPLRGPAAKAISAWLKEAEIESGPLFRRLYKGGGVASEGLVAEQVSRIVKRRAALAGLEGDWGGHSLRSGFVTEAGRQGVALGEVMAMTEHRSVNTVMGYFQAGSLLSSRASDLLGPELPSEPDDE